ncbi:MAG: hypothetical protein GX539_07780 [Candidatus Cloacimonetes bacterium]|nr:hypothetical protein [Candidatus Cloacimonadota bacterium]
MVQVHISTPMLGYSAGAMGGAAASFDAHLVNVNAVVTRVVGVTWTGPAADAFLAEWDAFLRSAGVTRESLVSISTRLYGAQGGYEGNEASIVAAARSSNVRSSMPGSNGGQESSPEDASDDGSVQV